MITNYLYTLIGIQEERGVNMAKLEREINTDFDELINRIEKEILDGSISATLEDSSDFIIDNARCSVRVFERYSAFGGNRLSLNVTLFQVGDGPIKISAISSGGSQAVFLKVNTFGETAFLECLENILDKM